MKKLVIGIIFNSKTICDKSIEFLEKKYGPTVRRSPVYDFDFTDYYEQEMGRELKRIFLFFDKEITNEELVDIKLYAEELEKLCACDYRAVNIDPGYISETEFALASFKKKTWVKQISDRVYLHTILAFENGEIKTFHHTFPEFRKKEIQEYLTLETSGR